jgi:hypothetical protein
MTSLIPMSIPRLHVSLKPSGSICEFAQIWADRYPTATKIVKVATVVLVVGLLIAPPFSAPRIVTAIIVVGAITGALVLRCSFRYNLIPPNWKGRLLSVVRLQVRV